MIKRLILKYNIRPIAVIVFFFLLMVVVKMVVCLPFKGPFLFFDEFYYKENALYLTKFKIFNNVYPPLYPLFLTIGFLFENFYTGFKVVNIVLSSLLIFPVWMLAKEFLNEKKSIVVAVLSLLMPYHFVYSRMVMSENLYYPICILTLYFVVKQVFTDNTKWAILSGFAIALSILTRYFAIVLIPTYLILYFLDIVHSWRNDDRLIAKKKIINALVSFGICALILALIFIPQLDYLLKRGSGYSNDTGESKQIIRFIGYVIIYFFYFFTLIIPFIPLFLSNIQSTLKRNSGYKNKILLYFILISSLFYILLSAWHSSVKAFDHTYLNGRYILYLGIPSIIFSFISMNGEIQTLKKRILLLSTSILLLFFTYFALNGVVFHTAKYLLIPHMSPNGYIFYMLFVPIVIASTFIYTIILSGKYKVHSILLIVFFQITLMAYSLFISPAPITVHGYKLLKVVQGEEKQEIYNGTSCLNYQISFFMRFWDKSNYDIISIPTSIDSCLQKGYLISSSKVWDNTPLDSYFYLGERYYIYKTPIIHSNAERDNLMDLFLSNARCKNVTDMDNNPYKKNLAFIDSKKNVFTKEDCEFSYNLRNKANVEKVLCCVFGFMPESKKWGVSDGMRFSVFYSDSTYSAEIMNEYILPSDENREIYINLPETKCLEYTLTFSTYNSGSKKGDWGCWQAIYIAYKPKSD